MNIRAVWFIDALVPVGSNWKWQMIIGPARDLDELYTEFFKDRNYKKYGNSRIRFRKEKGIQNE